MFYEGSALPRSYFMWFAYYLAMECLNVFFFLFSCWHDHLQSWMENSDRQAGIIIAHSLTKCLVF